jgi:NAD(P)-dependent dehydrogenase (short-subunit alcohol dehydrogenase family)
MSHTLRNKRALITGGSRGIGAAIVKRLAGEGSDVAFTYRSSPDKANETAKAAQALGVQAIAIQADSADPRADVAAVERTASAPFTTFYRHRHEGSIPFIRFILSQGLTKLCSKSAVNCQGNALAAPLPTLTSSDFPRSPVPHGCLWFFLIRIALASLTVYVASEHSRYQFPVAFEANLNQSLTKLRPGCPSNRGSSSNGYESALAFPNFHQARSSHRCLDESALR